MSTGSGLGGGGLALLVAAGATHGAHDEDVFSVDLADGDGDAHVDLVEDGVGLDWGESRGEKELSCDGVVVVDGRGTGLLKLSVLLLLLLLLARNLLSGLLLAVDLLVGLLLGALVKLLTELLTELLTALLGALLRAALLLCGLLETLGLSSETLAGNLSPEAIAAEAAALDGSGSATKVTCSTARVLENTTLGDADSNLTIGWDTSGLHHLLDADRVDLQ